jgi:hypothetical protein
MIPIFMDHVLWYIENPLFVDFYAMQRIYGNLNVCFSIVCIRRFIEKQIQILLSWIHFCWIQKIDILLSVCCLHVFNAYNYMSVNYGLLGFVVC